MSIDGHARVYVEKDSSTYSKNPFSSSSASPLSYTEDRSPAREHARRGNNAMSRVDSPDNASMINGYDHALKVTLLATLNHFHAKKKVLQYLQGVMYYNPDDPQDVHYGRALGRLSKSEDTLSHIWRHYEAELHEGDSRRRRLSEVLLQYLGTFGTVNSWKAERPKRASPKQERAWGRRFAEKSRSEIRKLQDLLGRVLEFCETDADVDAFADESELFESLLEEQARRDSKDARS